MNRVVITGMGAVTPLGNSIDKFWENIKAGKLGFSSIADIAGEDFPVKLCGRVLDFDPEKWINKKELRRTDRFTMFAVCAAMDALQDSGCKFEDVDPYRAGVICGVGIGGHEITVREVTKFNEKGYDRVGVFYIPMTIANMAAGTVAMKANELGMGQFKGDNMATTTACASSTHAIGEAFRKVKDGYLDVCLAGGAESTVNPFSLAGFANMKALSLSDDPTRCSVPFDKERNGFVMGEGSGMMVLESLDHALARGAKIYAEIAGYGATADAYHMTSPSPTGEAAAAAMIHAYKEAGLGAGDIDYINAHGTSTHHNDLYETIAIKLALGDHAKDVVINSTKSMTGHLLGAAGAVEAIVTALSLKDGYVHQTMGYKVADPECDLDYCTEGGRNLDIKAALTNNLGFGGHNATLCIRKYE